MHTTTIDGNTVTFAFTDGTQVAVTLSPAQVARLSLDNRDGRHLRKDTGDLMGSALDGMTVMLGAEYQGHVCAINGAFRRASEDVQWVPQLDLLVATEPRRPFSRTSPPPLNTGPAVYEYGA